MSIQSQIDRINNAKSSLKSAISSKGVSVPESANIEDLPALIRSIPQEGGGGGSGIIDVTELPTSNIDENAVYRVTENIQTEETQIYIVMNETNKVTMQQYLASLGIPTIPNVYVVDELPPDMLPTDVQTFSQLHLYILRSDGIAYLNAPAYGGVITAGLFGFQAMGYDKGTTENIYAETEQGVYTTLEAYKQIERWFIRENGEWKEITAYATFSPHGFENVEVFLGDITQITYGASDILANVYTEINEGWFLKRNGKHVDFIRDYAFANNQMLKTAVIPYFIKEVGGNIFNWCLKLNTVTFKGKPERLYPTSLENAINLTTLNVPWSEGEVEGAPWGATHATINYNYTGE